MTDPTRNRINAAFDDELSTSPVPPGLRELSIRDAVTAPRRQSVQPQPLIVVATMVVVAVVATFVIGSHVLRSTPVPAIPTGSMVPPAPRAGAAVAYDPVRNELVIFGGNVANGRPAVNETWTWDGKYWSQRHSAVSPTPRQDAVMAYDPVHRNAILFGGMEHVVVAGKGGCCAAAPVDDTWTWNGTQWQQRHPQHEPPLGFDFFPSMQYDPVSGTVLLFGFTQAKTEAMTDVKPETWSWNGSDWIQLNPSDTPTAAGVMAFDGRNLLMLSPSRNPISGRIITQTWSWSGSTWDLLHPKQELPQSGFTSAAYDAARGQLVMLSSDTWTWDGATWSRQHPSLQPLRGGYMAYVPPLKEIVSWGDRLTPTDNEMFAWDGSTWTVVQPGTVVDSADNGKGVVTVRMTAEQAATLVRSTVKNTHPVLLPASLPSGGPWDAFVTVTADDFNIQYESDLRDKTITFAIAVPNPAPGGLSSRDARVPFRNAVGLKNAPSGYAEYFVYDPQSTTGMRWLMWNEPGSMLNPMPAPGSSVPYFLFTTGLTDQEFWQVANSLQ